MTSLLPRVQSPATELAPADLPVLARPPTKPRVARRRALRGPLYVHLASLAAAFVLIVQVDWREWFFLDDWDYLVKRGLNHPIENIWFPHNEHWDTIPVLVWRGLYSVFGLHQFWPYLLVVLAAHIALAHVIWRVCVSEGLDPWLSTAFCAVFALLGAGAENLTWAAGIEFVWSMLFGFLALWVASGRRAWRFPNGSIALLVLASMMCSATGNVVAVAVGVVLLARAGWRRALRALWFPVACFTAWYVLVGHHALASNGDRVTLDVLTGIPNYAWTGLSGSLGVTFGLRAAGGALLVGLVVLIVVRFELLRRLHPVVLGAAIGAPAFFILASIGRERFGLQNADASRYVYVAIAFVLPAVVYAADWLIRNQRPARLPIYVLIALMLVANYGLLRSFSASHEALVVPQQRQILADATVLSEGAPSLPGAPIAYAPALTPTQLRRLVAEGELSKEHLTTAQRLGTELSLGVSLTSHRVFKGHFTLLLVSQIVAAPAGRGCVNLQPVGSKPRFMLAAQAGGSSGQFTAGSSQPVTVSLFSPGKKLGPSKTWILPQSATLDLNVITEKNAYPVITFFPAQVSTFCGVTIAPGALRLANAKAI